MSNQPPVKLVQTAIKAQLSQWLDSATELKTISVSPPTQHDFGDLTTNAALVSFKSIRSKTDQFESPTALAQWLATQLRQQLILDASKPIFSRIEVAGNGFINFYFSEQFLWFNSLALINQKSILIHLKTKRTRKIMVEYTDPNPFKELHIGHAYSNAVGETIARHLEALGHTVKRACYQGDVGMHVAKTIWGWLHLGRSTSKLSALSLKERVTFLGRAYAKGATAYKENENAKEQIRQLNYLVFIAAQDRLKIETGWQPRVDYRRYLNKAKQFDYDQVKELYFTGREWSLVAFEKEYRRLGTKFDFYFFESQMGEVGYTIVKRFLTQGIFIESQGAVIFPGKKYGLHDRVFINSLGLPTYEAKELGLALVKYQQFAYDRSIVVTANEIDEYFKVLLKAMSLVLPDLAKKTTHVSHGLVKLTSGKMSSRTGRIVRAKDVLDQLESLALANLHQRQGLSAAEKRRIATKVAVAAIKFSFLKSSLGGDIAFDPEKAVAFTGESGPYLQYSYVRTQSVWRQLKLKFNLDKSLVIDTLLNNKEELDRLIDDDIESKELDILRKLNQYFDVVDQSAREIKPHLLANYLFNLAQSFSRFYETVPILVELKNKNGQPKAEDLSKTTQRRLLITEMTGQVLKHGLWILGIETVEKM